jgi:hypothetical protein
MQENGRTPDSPERAFWSWLAFWVQFLVLGMLAVYGAVIASRAARSGDYASGMLLSLGAIALAVLRLKHGLGGGNSGWVDYLLVDNMWSLAVAIPIFTIIGLAGLFMARAWEFGTMHAAGLALFVISGVIIFLDIKHVFDRMDSERR